MVMWMVKIDVVLGSGAGVLWKVLFIGLSSKCLLSTCCVPDTSLGPGATGDTFSAPMDPTSIFRGSPLPWYLCGV